MRQRDGHSEPYFKTSKGAMDSICYANDSNKGRLVPFIEKYHSDDQYMFWPIWRPATIHCILGKCTRIWEFALCQRFPEFF